jgi:hypothetical protein
MTRREFKIWVVMHLVELIDMVDRPNDQDTLEGWGEEFAQMVRLETQGETDDISNDR